jgi:hypothetical protein
MNALLNAHAGGRLVAIIVPATLVARGADESADRPAARVDRGACAF